MIVRSAVVVLAAILAGMLVPIALADNELIEDIIEEVLLFNLDDKGKAEKSIVDHPPQMTDHLNMAQHNEGSEPGRISENANLINDIARALNTRTLDEMSLSRSPKLNSLVTQREELVCPSETIDCSQRDLTYRPFDGVCNNLNNPKLGTPFTAQDRLSPALWERRGLVETRTSTVGELVPLDPQGVRLTIPTYFSVAGTADLKLTIFYPDEECIGQKIRSAYGKSVSKTFPGIITSSRPSFYGSRCVKNINFFVHGDTVTVSGKCSGTFKVCFQKPHVELILRKGQGQTSVMRIDGVQVDSDVNPEQRYPDNEEDAQPYWIRASAKGNVRVGKNGECHREKIFLRGKTPFKNLTDALCPYRYNLAITALSTGSIYVRVPVETVAEVETDAFSPLTLNDYPSVYANGGMRFGYHKRHLSDTNYILRVKDITHGITVSVTFGSSCSVKYLESGVFKEAKFLNSRRLRAAPPFVDGDGSGYTAYGALWITWIRNRIYIGSGNLVGQNDLAGVLTLNIGTAEFTAEQVELSSVEKATWLFDLVQQGTPRKTGVTGRPLPTARDVSLRVHTNIGQTTTLSPRLTMGTMNFGQFVDHDVVATPIEEVPGGEPLMCCVNGKPLPPEDLCRFCFNIDITSVTDPNGSQGQFPFPQTECIPMVRSAVTLNCDTSSRDLRSREQLTVNTALTDGSNIYGSTEEEAEELRAGADHSSALLRTSLGGRELPTTSEAGEAACNNAANTSQLCFQAGDFRSSEQPGLTGMHGLWVREHNRVASALIASGYPVHTKDEREIVFQEARRIVIAEYQQILYNGYLRAFLDETTFNSFNLGNGQCTYDSSLNINIFNEWGIAYRMGHTWIRPTLEGNSLRLVNHFFNPALIHDRNSDFLHRNYYTARCPNTDRIMEPAITEDLFRMGNGGLDLAALNIQRGRDHGVGYCEVREALGLRIPLTFERAVTEKLFTRQTANRLMDVYDCVCDMDLFTGMVAERPLGRKKNSGSSSVVGETLNSILATFFRRSKCGDRYWFEFSDAGFTSSQLTNLRSITLASIICANTANVTTIQPDVFNIADDKTNKPVACSHIPSLSMSMFAFQSDKRSMDTVAKAEHTNTQESVNVNNYQKGYSDEKSISKDTNTNQSPMQNEELTPEDIDDGLDNVETRRMSRIRGDRRPNSPDLPDVPGNRDILHLLKNNLDEKSESVDVEADSDDSDDIDRTMAYANLRGNSNAQTRNGKVLMDKLTENGMETVDNSEAKKTINENASNEEEDLDVDILKALLEKLEAKNLDGKLSKKYVGPYYDVPGKGGKRKK